MWGILPPIIAYSFRHPHFPALHQLMPYGKTSRPGFTAQGTLPYHALVPKDDCIRSFGAEFQSRPLSAQIHLTGELLRTL